MVILILPLFDTLRMFSIRLFSGKSPFKGDRNHFHHILLDRGFSHWKSTIFLLIFNLLAIYLYSEFSNQFSNNMNFILYFSLFILYCLKPNIFKLISPYAQLKRLQQTDAGFSNEINRDEDNLATIIAYEEEGGRFKPENIFKFEENLKDHLNLLLRKPEIAKYILESSQNWILSEQEHKNREQLSSQFFENYNSVNFSIISDQQEQISAQQQEILTLKKETAEQKEERQTQEDLQKSANSPNQTKIISYFKLETNQCLGKRPINQISQ
jgi:hypothetical protein